MTKPEDAYLRFPCPTCRAMLQARQSKAGRMLPCPGCKSFVEVPRTETAPAETLPEDEYALRDMGAPSATVPLEEPGPAVIPVAGPLEQPPEEDRSEKENTEPAKAYNERPKLPRHPMSTGVLTFLFDPVMVVCGSVLTIGVAMILGLLVGSVGGAAIAGAGTWTGSMVMAGFAAVLGSMWLVVASAFLLSILQDSAAGNEKVENWPDVIFLDWIADCLYVAVSLFVAGAIGVGLAWLCGGVGPGTWVFIPLSLYLFFPVVQLSTLELQSPLLPLSPIVLRSLFTSWTAWAVFYIETGLLGATFVGLLALVRLIVASVKEPGLQLLLLGVFTVAAAFVASLFLYYRLLGRLAWVCAEESREEEDLDEDEEEETGPKIHPTPVDDF